MKIVYLLDDDISKESGIIKKIQYQTSFWKNYGHDVTIVSLRSRELNSNIESGIILSKMNFNENKLKKIILQFKNIKKLNNILKELKPDLIYVRYMNYYPKLVKIIQKYSNYILEINTNDVYEKKGLIKYYNLFTRKILLKNSNGIIFVSNELKNDKYFKSYAKNNSIVIANGYNFNDVTKIKKNFNKEIKFIFVGTPGQIWHGIDKIILLARYLKKNEFHIVGYSKKELNKSINTQIPKNIICHGYQNNTYIEKLLMECDIGISTLALHRKKMDEASPLKSRQYLAHGLPIIVGYKDTDLDGNFPFILNIGNCENNVLDNLKNIENFMEKIKYMKPEDIHKEARLKLDYIFKEKQRIKFFNKVINNEI